MKKILLASFLIVFAAFAGIVFAGYTTTDVVSISTDVYGGGETVVEGAMAAIRNSGNSVEYIECGTTINSITICEAKNAAGTYAFGYSVDSAIATQVRSINSITRVAYEIETNGVISSFGIVKGSQYME